MNRSAVLPAAAATLSVSTRVSEWLRRTPLPGLRPRPAALAERPAASPLPARHGLLAAGRAAWLAVAALAVAGLVGCERTGTEQRGYRGTGMLQLQTADRVAAAASSNAIPEPEAQEAPDPEAPSIKEVYQNVQVLNDLTILEFARLMQAMSTWIAPEQGCEFCHNPDKLESDEKYTKVVARRMLEMTRKINTDWKPHVAGTGVTCWTCHRGQAVPSGDWFAPAGHNDASMLGRKAGQNTAGQAVNGNTSLPNAALSHYLEGGDEVRVQGTTALPTKRHDSVQKAEWTYSLMIYMSQSLGVNCTYCHNTRAMANWQQSTPQRVTAWHGIRLVRELNNGYLSPLKSLFPPERLSAEGDGPKVGCETCHKGWFKPLNGVSMLGDYPELAGVMVRPPAPAGSSPMEAAGLSPAVAAPAAAPASAPLMQTQTQTPSQPTPATPSAAVPKTPQTTSFVVPGPVATGTSGAPSSPIAAARP